MAVARKLVTLGRAARNKVNIKIRQPLSEMLIVLSDSADELAVRTLAPIIKDELNIKSVSIAQDAGELMDYRIKPRFDLLGPKYGKLMKDIQAGLGSLDQREVVSKLESEGSVKVPCGGKLLLSTKKNWLLKLLSGRLCYRERRRHYMRS